MEVLDKPMTKEELREKYLNGKDFDFLEAIKDYKSDYYQLDYGLTVDISTTTECNIGFIEKHKANRFFNKYKRKVTIDAIIEYCDNVAEHKIGNFVWVYQAKSKSGDFGITIHIGPAENYGFIGCKNILG